MCLGWLPVVVSNFIFPLQSKFEISKLSCDHQSTCLFHQQVDLQAASKSVCSGALKKSVVFDAGFSVHL